ncbi:Glutaredoxin [seawater metagenome]|uniref:Glutaredoxin n=1 Tax=seawater metagenome TaxID=1561972 RepID=A0A5E8CLD5_9ZZZZ
MIYESKYKKYKAKYLQLKSLIQMHQAGGSKNSTSESHNTTSESVNDSVTTLTNTTHNSCHIPGVKAEFTAKIVTKDGCGWCTKAKSLLEEKNIKYCESAPDENFEYRTVPQVWINGKHVGGYEDLEEYLGKEDSVQNLVESESDDLVSNTESEIISTEATDEIEDEESEEQESEDDEEEEEESEDEEEIED